jgi:hypothetical protein
MSRKALDGADEIALHIELHKLGGKGAIDILSFIVDGDALNMAAAEFSGFNGERKIVFHDVHPL